MVTEISNKLGFPISKVRTSQYAFDKAIRTILLNADEVHLKGLFSLRMKPHVRKRVMNRGKSLVVGRKSFSKSRKRKYMNNLNKRRRKSNNQKK